MAYELGMSMCFDQDRRSTVYFRGMKYLLLGLFDDFASAKRAGESFWRALVWRAFDFTSAATKIKGTSDMPSDEAVAQGILGFPEFGETFCGSVAIVCHDGFQLGSFA